MDVVTENVEKAELKIQENSSFCMNYFPIVKRARTKNLAFLFNMAARILNNNHQLVICINFTSDIFLLSINEILYLKKLYRNWILAYIKGYTNEKPTFAEFAKRTGYSMHQIKNALNNKPLKGFTLTYGLMKEWGYIYES